MTEHAAICGTFSDLKTVKTRSVVQMIIEVPIEHGEQIIAAFGFPRPGDEVPVAVARLDPEKASAPPAASEKVKKPFKDYELSQQAGMRCQDERFQMFLMQVHQSDWPLPADDAKPLHEISATVVRLICGVSSRADFDSDGHGCHKWIALNAEYEQWAGLSADER